MSYIARLWTSIRNRRWDLATTVSLCLGIVVLGIYYEMSGPTLPDLKHKVGADYEEISRVLVAQSAAMLVSCFVGGYLTDRYRRHIGLTLCLSQLLVGVMTGVSTWSRRLWLLGLCYFLQGLGIGPLVAGGNAWIMWIWGPNSAAPNYAFHWAFGIGAFIAPQLAKSFISGVRKDDPGNTTTNNGSNMSEWRPSEEPGKTVATIPVMNTSAWSMTEEPRWQPDASDVNIEYAYLICGVLAGVVGLMYLVLQCNRSKIGAQVWSPTTGMTRQESTTLRDILSPAQCSGGHSAYGTAMVCLVFIYHFLVVGGERSWGRFLFSYAKEQAQRGELDMDTDEMSDLQSTFWLTFFIGRGVAMLLANSVPPLLMISVVYVLYLVNAVLLATLGPTSSTALWVCSSTFGALVAPLFPGAIVIYRDYIHISAMIMALSQAGAAFGGMFFQWMSGYLLEYHSPNSLLYFNVIYILALILVYVTLVLTGRCHLRRVEQGADEEFEEEMKAVSG